MATHLAFPIAVTSRGLATVDQDSDADIVQSVTLLLNTRPGERRSVPDYGLPDPVFSKLDEAEVAAVVSEWEQRARIDELDITSLALPPAPVDLPAIGTDTDGVPFTTGVGTSIGTDTDGVPFTTGVGTSIGTDTDGTPYVLP